MIKTVKVVGLNLDTDVALALFSQVPKTSLNLPTLHFFILVSCLGEDVFLKVRETLSESEELFSSLTLRVPERLEEVLSLVRRSLSETEELNVLVAACQEDSLGSVFYLRRQGNLVGVSILRVGKQMDLGGLGEEGELVSGMLQEGDRVILGTKSFFELLEGQNLVLENILLEGIEDEVSARLPQAEVCPLAALVVEKEREKIEKVEIDKPLEGENRKFFTKEIFLSLVKTFSPKARLLLKAIPRSKRGVALLGVALLLVVLTGLILNFQRKKEVSISLAFEEHFQKASEQYNQASSLNGLDNAQAGKSLAVAKEEVALALKIRPENEKAKSLQEEIEKNSGAILGIFQISDFPLWLDLGLIKKELRPANLSLSLGNLLVFDGERKVVAKVALETKAAQILGGGEKLGEGKLASLNGDLAWIFSQDKGLLRLDTRAGQIITASSKDEEWGKIVDLQGFANNAYLLDETNNQIWKYIAVAKGYADKRSYLQSDAKVNFSGAKRMQIDSSVWVLKEDGTIFKYTQGEPDFFSFSGLDQPLKNPRSFFISDQTDNLYVLDSGNQRLMVLDKRGVYKLQYRSDQFGSFQDLVVDEKGKKVYLLEEGKIYQMELK